MKYRIGYMMVELNSDNFGKLDAKLCSDFIPLEPALIFDDYEQAISKVKELKFNEEIKAILLNNFNSSGDKFKNYCYDEID